MPLDKRELSYLWDMQNAAREISELMRNVKFHKFENDKFMRYAAERLLLIIGEAANTFLRNFAKNNPKFPRQSLSVFAISLHMNMGKA